MPQNWSVLLLHGLRNTGNGFMVHISFVVSDHQPLKKIESLSTKVNRVRRWYDFLSGYTYTSKYFGVPAREGQGQYGFDVVFTIASYGS